MLDKVRNIGIIAHVDAGKTTTTERILYFGGSKHKAGDVDEGNTTTDFDPLEKAKGITINSAAVTVEWNDTHITLIDTPGHVDFTAEVERSLRVLDGAVGVFCAVGGVEVQSETVWHQANKHHVPRIAFVNKLDRTGADFYGCVQQMKDKFGIVPAICTIPAGQGSDFQGVIDLLRMKFWAQDPNDPTHLKYEWQEIPAAYRAEAEKGRELLLDAASHACDQLLERVLEGQPVGARCCARRFAPARFPERSCRYTADRRRNTTAYGCCWTRSSITYPRLRSGRRSRVLSPKRRNAPNANPRAANRLSPWLSRR